MHKISILIPTHSRPEYAFRAVMSVLQQQRDDVEVIVSDSGGEEALEARLNALHTPQVVYVNTKGISIQQNWAAGFAHSTGENIAILFDREQCPDGMLNRIAALLREFPGVPVGWMEAAPPQCAVQEADPVRLSSGQCLEDLVKGACGCPCFVELRAQTLCYPRALFQTVTHKLGGGLMDKYAFDLSAPVQLLFECPEILYIPERMKRTDKTSTQTVQSFLFPEKILRDWNITEEETYAHVPIKYYFLFNHILNGILWRCARNGLKVELSDDVLEIYFQHMYQLYRRAMEKYGLSGHGFMRAYYDAVLRAGMQEKPWFQKMVYFWE